MKKLDIFNELSEHIYIKINSCRNEFHDSSWVESKSHMDYDLWLLLEGDMAVETGGKVFRAYAGDAVFFCPAMLYTAYMGSCGCRFIYTHFNFSIGNNLRILEGFNLWGIIHGKTIHEETLLFKKAYAEYHRKTSVSSMLLKGAFTMLLAGILSSVADRKAEDCFIAENSGRKSVDALTVLQPVFRYVSANMQMSLRVGELSKIAGMSEKYFITYFKSALGISPGRYINQLKMNRARDYLYEKKHSVKEIAYMLGYPNPYAFSKAFRKYYNVPPSKFV